MTPNLNLKTNFLGCGSNLESTLKHNFEAADLAAVGATGEEAATTYRDALQTTYLGCGSHLAAALTADFEKIAMLIEDPEAEVVFSAQFYVGCSPHLSNDVVANFNILAEHFATMGIGGPEG